MKHKNAFYFLIGLFMLALMPLRLCAQLRPLVFVPMWVKDTLHLNVPQQIGPNQSITLLEFKFYLTHIELYHEGKKVWIDPIRAHLLNAADDGGMKVLLNTNDILWDEMRCLLGTDSETNVSGALEGDLDPIHGMYWTWQSGYINSKVSAVLNNPDGTQNVFEYHLGGYAYPFATAVPMRFRRQCDSQLVVALQLEHFFRSQKLNQQNKLMLPGSLAQSLAALFSECFISMGL